MFLRSLIIRGFKSFADRTTLEFGPGISVIVGPNGSGKSNVADAISWVLGEQGPRALRGSQMADVIFAGGQGRPGLGMAEVKLVIDNTAGLIPTEAAEIEVSRTIYASGESQYAIGGKACRLMDIQEILSDTGIGRGLHTVIGQGHLEDALTTRPEGRRQFIEEAAGIAKHRRRKERAQRKLSGIEQDLLRLQDVMTELRRQLKPLKQQAEAAQKYETLEAEAGALAWRMAAARLRDLLATRDRRLAGWKEGEERKRGAEERLAALDAEIKGLDGRVAAAEAALDEAEAAHQTSLAARTAAEAALREGVRAEGEARAKVAADQGRSGRLFTLEEEARRTEDALAETRASLEAREVEIAEAEERFRAAEQVRREAEDERHQAHEATISRRAEIESLRRSLESAEGERERVSVALEEVRAREAGAEAERARLQEEVERLDAEETPIAERQAALVAERDRLAAELAHLDDGERRLEARRNALEAKRQALAETPGSRFLRKAKHAIGQLRDLIEIDEGMEAAVAAALGPMLDAVVYLDHGEAVAEAADAAGATLAIVHEGTGGVELDGEKPLERVVEADERVAPLVRSALGGVFLARDGREALAKHRRHPEASFVTKAGVLVGPGVVRTAWSRERDAEVIRREDEAMGRDLARLRSQLAGKRGRMTQIEDELESVESELAGHDARITAAAEQMARLGSDLTTLARERGLLEERLERIEEGARSSREALAKIPPESEVLAPLPPHAEPPIALRVEVEALRRERARLEAGMDRVRRELDEVRSTDPETLRAEAETATRAREEAEQRLAEAEERAAAGGARRAQAQHEAADARSAAGSANEAWREAAAALQRLRDEYEDEDQARRDLERRIAEAERVLAEGHDKQPAEAVAELADDDTLESLQKRSDLVARRLGLLGRVNLVASEEYRALQERHDFLAREIDDVRSAKHDLQTVVREVDRKIVEIWDAAFRDTAAEFERIVAGLFPGGEGRLELTEPDDPLTTGVEIKVRPGKKRIRQLSLLSGGERSLVALGFLFAIFRARPSPFYLLDEVEAALDDVNLHRFLELTKDFARDSQVMVITHQKRTMESADVLYGVSMGAGGASAVISQRVAEAVAAAESK